MIVVMFLSMIIQNMLQSRFEKYSRVRTNSGMTGAEIARKMLADTASPMSRSPAYRAG